jgi:2-oxoglutarate dehydrogenase E2 component (dihydrolipoamide succinyltransferase)
LRKDYKDFVLQEHNQKLGYMSGFVLAATQALKAIPAVNASIDNETDEIVYKDYVDISVAVATPKGLVTPVLRDCQNMSLVDVERNLSELSQKVQGLFGSNPVSANDFVPGQRRQDYARRHGWGHLYYL